MLETQNSLRDAKFPVIVLFAGVDGAGKSEVVKLLNEWMDTRWLINRAYHRSTESHSDEEVPAFRRYWADLPPKGRMGLFLSAWYSPVLLGTVYREVTDADFFRHVERIRRFEQNLTMDGALILKYWLHLDKRQQRKRLERLEANSETSWRVNHTDWAHWAMYHRFVDAGDQIIDATETTYAPWQVIDGKNHCHLSITIAEQILDAVKTRLEQPLASKPTASQATASKPAASQLACIHKPSPVDWLSQVDLKQTLTQKDYRLRLSAAHGELNRLDREARRRGIPSVLAFEGWDAAGKGGAIRRMLRALDPRHYRVIPVAAPTQEEHAQHYLWRFWSQVPTRGQMAIFDRSWYGRVLVERVEGFAEPDEWKRAYFEINEFEKELVENGMMMCKFWLHITPEEQLRRFKERKHTLHKAWKLTDEDWRNRDKWGQYDSAVNDMIEYTNTPHAPWTIVPANDKNWARITVLETACERLRQILQ